MRSGYRQRRCGSKRLTEHSFVSTTGPSPALQPPPPPRSRSADLCMYGPAHVVTVFVIQNLSRRYADHCAIVTPTDSWHRATASHQMLSTCMCGRVSGERCACRSSTSRSYTCWKQRRPKSGRTSSGEKARSRSRRRSNSRSSSMPPASRHAALYGSTLPLT